MFALRSLGRVIGWVFGVVGFGKLRGDGHRKRGKHVGEQIHQQQLTSPHRRPPGPERRPDDGEQNFAHIAADQNRHRVTNTGPHAAALDQRVEQHAQVIVGQHDIGGPTGGRGTAPAHSDAHVGHPDGRGVVGAVADHRGHSPAALQRRHNLNLLFRADPSKDLHVGGEFGMRLLVQDGKFGTGHDSRVRR
ncbi:Uncharacterised protein [Mycobacterium tuberculosis]|uniref:Uncharacterized protein n=1 Tax=Mycobacterium tuberculosis TaxID=1773 RepID=A0A655F4L4_MYCTX|nr:Uncharacterised protein [Mycobacterium tuberculosis]CNV49814.1 Uncharacterised protein [Mycobacterium tuberculosis]